VTSIYGLHIRKNVKFWSVKFKKEYKYDRVSQKYLMWFEINIYGKSGKILLALTDTVNFLENPC
jgi:phage regulator Rha-like protein